MSITSVVPLISVCIPTYHEESYIQKTLANISQQTMWDKMEVVIADYNDGDDLTLEAIKELDLGDQKVLYTKSPEKDISFQRNWAVRASRGKYIVNMDADCVFVADDAIERLVKPLETGIALLTHCTVVLDESEANFQKTKSIQNMIWDAAQSLLPALPVASAHGLTTTREVFEALGGFKGDIGEDWNFTFAFVLKYGMAFKMMLKDVVILHSPRRYAYNQPVTQMFDYSKGYRKGNVIKT